jgi:hypothetical protein
MAKWTPEEDAALTDLAKDGFSAKEIAAAIGRSEGSVSGRVAKLGVSLCSRQHQTLREYLRDGGPLARDDVGGIVGVHWTKAARTGEAFSATICERFVALGFLRPDGERPNVFRWAMA